MVDGTSPHNDEHSFLDTTETCYGGGPVLVGDRISADGPGGTRPDRSASRQRSCSRQRLSPGTRQAAQGQGFVFYGSGLARCNKLEEAEVDFFAGYSPATATHTASAGWFLLQTNRAARPAWISSTAVGASQKTTEFNLLRDFQVVSKVAFESVFRSSTSARNQSSSGEPIGQPRASQ